MTMLPATPQRTAESRSLEPTPMIALEITWVVDTGIPKCDAVEDDRRGRRLGREAVDRVELHDLLAHRLDDPPAAGRGPERDRGRGQDDDPERDRRVRRQDAGRRPGRGS